MATAVKEVQNDQRLFNQDNLAAVHGADDEYNLYDSLPQKVALQQGRAMR